MLIIVHEVAQVVFRLGKEASAPGALWDTAHMRLLLTICALAAAACTPAEGHEPSNKPGHLLLSRWERGISVHDPVDESMRMYLWFYEWNLFDAFKQGECTQGSYKLYRQVDDNRRGASLESAGLADVVDPEERPELKLHMLAQAGEVELTLHATNHTDRDWGRFAAIIPCFSPGHPKVDPNDAFVNEKTYFLGPDGLAPLEGRSIHFNAKHHKALDVNYPQGFDFSERWPAGEGDATSGLLVRESGDGNWVAGIGWGDFMTVQGHNPWNCMHVGVRVGALKSSATRKVRGRLYLFKGSKEDVVARFLEDFPQ